MSRDRNTFLQRISRCLGRQDNKLPYAPAPFARPNDVQSEYLRGASPEELKREFIANAGAAGTIVLESDLGGVNDAILTAIPQLAQGPILLSDDPFWKKHGTASALRTIEADVRHWDTSRSREENIAFAEKAAVGLAVAALALAETGTVMLYSHKGCGRSVTLLPTTTLFIVHADTICRRLTQAMVRIEAQSHSSIPSAIHFISGASSTSDIELVRVQGVHGPMKIAYIVVKE